MVHHFAPLIRNERLQTSVIRRLRFVERTGHFDNDRPFRLLDRGAPENLEDARVPIWINLVPGGGIDPLPDSFTWLRQAGVVKGIGSRNLRFELSLRDR